ncbi:DUF927 domain-containing protein [Leclercia adecarboxylata]|uniref:DUF927 domain-containing protein n=1 Tax=Leclercia adecarboxylata TaxID=83655 RepID=UPI0030192BA1
MDNSNEDFFSLLLRTQQAHISDDEDQDDSDYDLEHNSQVNSDLTADEENTEAVSDHVKDEYKTSNDVEYFDDDKYSRYLQAYEDSGIQHQSPVEEAEYPAVQENIAQPLLAEKVVEPAQVVKQDESRPKGHFRPQLAVSTPEYKSLSEEKQQLTTNGSEIFFTDPEGKITSQGFFINVAKKENGKVVTYPVKKHPFFLYPVEVYSALDVEDTEVVRFRFKSFSGQVKEICLPGNEVNKFGNRSELTKQFPAPPNGIISKITSMILNAIDKLPAEKKGIGKYSKSGWTADGKYHIRPGHPQYINIGSGAEYGSLMKAGTKEQQYKTYREMTKESLIAAFVLAAAVAGYMRGKCFVSTVSQIVVLHGKRGFGKTTMLMLVSAIQGKPSTEAKTNMFSGKTTQASLDRELAGNNHGVAALDESDSVLLSDKKKGIDQLMNIGNGGGNARMENGVSTTYSHDMTIFASFNSPYKELISGHDKAEALINRITGINILDPNLNTFNDAKTVENYQRQLLLNYGHMYDDIIDYISNNEVKINDKYKEVYDEMYKDTKLHLLRKYDSRALQFFSICYAGAEALGKILDDEECSARAVEAINLLVENYKSESNGNIDLIELEENIPHQVNYEKLLDFISTNPSLFHWKKYAYTPSGHAVDQKHKAEELNRGSSKIVLGVVNQESVMKHPSDFNGGVIINEQGYREFERVSNITKNEIIESVKALDMLIKQNNKNTYKVSEAMVNLLNLDGRRGYNIRLKDLSLFESEEGNNKEVTNENKYEPLTTMAPPIIFHNSDDENIFEFEESYHNLKS